MTATKKKEPDNYHLDDLPTLSVTVRHVLGDSSVIKERTIIASGFSDKSARENFAYILNQCKDLLDSKRKKDDTEAQISYLE